MNCETIKDFLNAYHDGELDLFNSLEVERHLAECETCRIQAANIGRISNLVSSSDLYFKAPLSLKDRISAQLPSSSSPAVTSPAPVRSAEPGRTPWWRWPAAVTAVCAILIAGLILVIPPANNDLIAREVVASHVRSMMADHLMDVPSTDKHTVKPWFEGKLDFSPPVVDLAADGYPLTGGRLDYIGSRPVAALVYKRNQHIINLFIFPSTTNADSTPKMSVRQGFNLITWDKSAMTFWAVSDLNLEELQEFAGGIRK